MTGRGIVVCVDVIGNERGSLFQPLWRFGDSATGTRYLRFNGSHYDNISGEDPFITVNRNRRGQRSLTGETNIIMMVAAIALIVVGTTMTLVMIVATVAKLNLPKMAPQKAIQAPILVAVTEMQRASLMATATTVLPSAEAFEAALYRTAILLF